MLAGIRFTTAGILIFMIAAALGKSIKITGKQLLNCIFAGFLFLSIGNGGVVWSLKYVDSGFAALEISAQPLIVLILMRIIQAKPIKPTSIIGIILGITGIYLLVSEQEIVQQENSEIGMIIIFLCMVSWAYASIFVGRANMPTNFFVNTSYQMLSGGLILFLASLIIGEEWIPIQSWETQTLSSMVILIIFGSIVAFTSFNFLLKNVSPEKVATSTYVNPVVALLLGWYFLNETITLQMILAAVILLTGVFFINKAKIQLRKRP